MSDAFSFLSEPYRTLITTGRIVLPTRHSNTEEISAVFGWDNGLQNYAVIVIVSVIV